LDNHIGTRITGEFFLGATHTTNVNGTEVGVAIFKPSADVIGEFHFGAGANGPPDGALKIVARGDKEDGPNK
jgi:hypothetical protein